jgi:hypothetical protein
LALLASGADIILDEIYAPCLAAAVLTMLAACGGGGGGSTAVTPPPVITPPVVTPTQPDYLTLSDHCATPRTGLQPNGLPYYDLQGTLAEEKRWLRSFIDETYLWYAKCRPI